MNRFLPIIFLLFYLNSHSQNDTLSFKRGEFLKFKIQYGLLNAGFATVELKANNKKNDSLIHSVAKGWSTGMLKFFFPVEDLYESYFTEIDLKPKYFIRKINEGGYTQDKELHFDFDSHQAKEINHKKNTEKSFFIQNNVQDMISSFYYMRSIDFTTLKETDSIDINMFFDGKMNPIKLIILGRETIKTDFGKIKTIKLRPLVLKGRVFKDEENVTLWISDDYNKIPLKIKASLLVGAAKAELIEYNGLVHPFP
jgi:hypothetical protein